MMRNPAYTTTTLLLATSPLFACATSVFAAVIVAGVMLLCTLCAAIIARLTASPPPLWGGAAFREGPGAGAGAGADAIAGAPKTIHFIISTVICASIVAAGFIALVIAGYSDIIAAFAPQMVLAAFAAALLGASEKSVPIALTSCWQLALVGLLCELVGRGTVLGDHELAFAGATRDWLIRVVDFAPLPLVATPAGALIVASMVTAVTALLCSSAAGRSSSNEHNTAVPVITEPRSGRRVRVTGHIS